MLRTVTLVDPPTAVATTETGQATAEGGTDKAARTAARTAVRGAEESAREDDKTAEATRTPADPVSAVSPGVNASTSAPTSVPVAVTATAAATARQGSATAAVVAHLEDLLFSGAVEAGDTLPSEAELSAAVGVSRLTVREAVRSLVARGLITISHGRRPVVAPPNAAPLHDFFSAAVRRDSRSLIELLDLRLAVEAATAELAARHAVRADLDAIAAALEAMRATADDEDAFNDADIRFHAAVARASGNRMLALLVEGMEGPLHHSFPQSLRGYRATGASTDELIKRHAEIDRCIRERDASGAAAATRRHLEATRTELRVALASGG